MSTRTGAVAPRVLSGLTPLEVEVEMEVKVTFSMKCGCFTPRRVGTSESSGRHGGAAA